MRIAIILLLVLLAAGTVAAEWKSLVGETAPAFDAGSWIVAPEGETAEDLRGRVVLLLLGPPMNPVPFNDLRAAWWEDGLRIIQVRSEEPEEQPGDVECCQAVGGFGGYGHGETSFAVLIGANGKVAWEGKPGDLPEALMVKLLKKAKAFHLRKLSAAAKPFSSAFAKGRLGEAHALATEQLLDEGASEEVRTEATYVANRTEALLSFWQRQAERAAGAGNIVEAFVLTGRIAKHFAGTPDGDAAAVKLKEWKSDKTLSKQKSAASGYARLRADMVRAGDKEKKIDAVVKKTERFVAKYAGTRSAQRAQRMLDALKGDPAVTAIRNFIARERISTSGAGWKTRLPKPPKVSFLSTKSYFWVLETSHGTIRIRLMPDVAPMHVSSTIYLTELGFYNGLVFHRVITGFMAQGGCPEGNGRGSPGYKYDGEFSASVKHDRAGRLSMANAGPGTDGSQFFITFKETPHLDGKHTIFGEVVSGMDTVKRLESLGSASGATKEKITLEKATVVVE